MTNRAGRPSKKSEAICDEILTRLAEGEPLAQICRDAHMPGVTTVWDWEQIDQAFSERIARARLAGHDMIAARSRMTARGFDSHNGGESSGDVQRDKLIIDTDHKLLAKWDPRRYGDRQQVDLSGGIDLKKTVDPGALASEIGQLLADPEVQRLLKG